MLSTAVTELSLSGAAVYLLIFLLTYLVVAGLLSMRHPPGFPPGPRGSPFVGHIPLMMKHKDTFPFLLNDLTKKYGDIFTLKLGGRPFIVLNNIELVKEALIKKQNDFAGRFASIFSLQYASEGNQGITLGEFTPKWNHLRKLVHQAMRNYANGEKLERLVREDTFPKLCKAFEEKNAEAFDPLPIIRIVAANVIATMCFGRKYALDDPEFKQVMHLNHEVNFTLGEGGFLADVIPVFQYVPTSGLRYMMKVVDEWFALIKEKITQHVDKFDPEHVTDLVDEIIYAQKQMDDSEAEQTYRITDVNLRQSVSDIFGAGLDTVNVALCWSVACLVNYPDVQVKVQNELDDVIGQNRLPLLSDKSHLPYCEAVIREVLRFRTVVPITIPHSTTCDTSVGGYNIPKDSWVWINVLALHTDERQWENPQEFHPERFLDEDGKLKSKPDSYLPFSAGRRVCVGEMLAKNELFLVFTSLFQQFILSSPVGEEPPDLEPTFNMALRPKPYEIIAKRRIQPEYY
ncbi:cytochrome P450 2D6-like [Glandiceps talaboti]